MDTASARERVLRYIPALKENGIHLEVHVAGNLGSGKTGKLKYLFNFGRNIFQSDAVLIHRVHLSPRERKILRFFGKPTYFDIDDAIWYSIVPDEEGNPIFSPRAENLLETIRLCRFVRTGNQYLSDFVQTLGVPTRIAPTCVPVSDLPPRRKRTGTRIGWTGNSSSFHYFSICKEAIQQLLQEDASTTFTVIAEKPPDLPGIPFEFREWSLEKEREYLDEFDIGIMPLADDKWAGGKCGYKLLLYMSLGIPAVASPVGVNKQILQNPEAGYLPQNSKEWYQALKALIQDPGLRDSVGQEGRKVAEKDYSTQVGLEDLLRDLQQPAPSGETS